MALSKFKPCRFSIQVICCVASFPLKRSRKVLHNETQSSQKHNFIFVLCYSSDPVCSRNTSKQVTTLNIRMLIWHSMKFVSEKSKFLSLLNFKHHAMKVYRGMETAPCILYLDARWGEWSASYSSCFTVGKDLVLVCSGMGFVAGLDIRRAKSCPC